MDNECTTYLNYLSAFFTFLAALFWFVSARSRIKHDENERDEHGMKPFTITVDGADLIKSLQSQSKWNATAATFAGIAALFQALDLYLS